MRVPTAYLAVVLIWSTTPLGIVWSSETVSPTFAVLMRMVIALILGAILLTLYKVELPKHRKAVTLYAYSTIGIFGGMLFSYFAASYISSGLMSLIFGLATVYRVLNQFDDAGIVTRHHFEGGKSVFELSQKQHHDHLVCLKCGKVVEFEDEIIENRQNDIAKSHDIKLTNHSLYLYGECNDSDACEEYRKNNQ